MKFLTTYKRKCWNRLPELISLTEEEISSNGYTVNTVEAAFWSFIHSDSFKDAIERAACLGDDADTVAAVTGALAGAYYGYGAIPKHWIEQLIGEEQIRFTAQRLYRKGMEQNAIKRGIG